MLSKAIFTGYHHQNRNNHSADLEMKTRDVSVHISRGALRRGKECRTNETKIVQSSQDRPDRSFILDHTRIPTKMGVSAKKTMHGIWTMKALLSPGRFPETAMIVNGRLGRKTVEEKVLVHPVLNPKTEQVTTSRGRDSICPKNWCVDCVISRNSQAQHRRRGHSVPGSWRGRHRFLWIGEVTVTEATRRRIRLGFRGFKVAL